MHLLKIKTTRFHNGERFPVIISENGMPEFYPNTFLASKLRNQHKQYNTMNYAGKGLQVLRVWEFLEGIDIVERMLGCEFLKNFEADSLCDAMWSKYDFLKERLQQKRVPVKARSKIRSLAAFRHQQNSDELATKARVKSGTVGGRMFYVIRYLKYLGDFGIHKETNLLKRSCLVRELDQMVESIAARAPDAFGGHINAEYHRLGLTYEVEYLLREVIKTDHHMNPWSKNVGDRNSMIIRILLNLGIRGGELLNLRVEDIDLRQNKIFIRRLPDNPDDPRLYEPNVKTLPRNLRMKDSLAADIQAYIVSHRPKHRGARKHDFLVVSSDDGSPLSRTAFNYIFKAVRNKVPGIPIDFGGHLCRHTWNDRFSDYCDKMGVTEEKEQKIRCKIMGWVPNSRMASVYTKRTTQAAVDKFSLGQQEQIAGTKLGGLINEITAEA